MKILKKNQLAILVIALMLVTAGYLNYTAGNSVVEAGTNTLNGEQYAAIGDATLVNSGEIIEENDKQNIINTINNANTVPENKEDTNKVNNEIKDENKDTVETAVTDNYFENSKLERDKMYSQMLETYEKVLNSNHSLETQKQSATEEITKINEIKNSIMICENLISTKGFANSVIFVNSDSVSVIVKSDKLEEQQIAQIQNIIARELKVDITNIHISNK